MSFSHPVESMFVLTRPKGPVTHEAILRRSAVGNLIVELHPERGLAASWTTDEGGGEGFEFVGTVPPGDLAHADARLRRLMTENPSYSATDFNCQHFVERVVSGRHTSHQVEALKGGIALVAVLLGVGALIAVATR